MEAFLRHDPLGITHDRLDDHGGDVVALLLEQPAEEREIVVARRNDRVGDRVRDPPAPGETDRLVGITELGHVVRRYADQGVVVDAVILALELHDLVAAGEGTGDPHRVHRRLGPGHGHARHVDPAGELLHELHRPDLILAREREADALAHLLVDVVVDPVVAVAEDDRAVAHPQVDVLVLVLVPDPAALAAVDIDGVLAPRPEVRVSPTRKGPQRALVERGLALAAERGGLARGSGLSGHEVTPRAR